MKSKVKKILQIMVPCIAFAILVIGIIIEADIKKDLSPEFGDSNGLAALFCVIPTAYFLIGYVWIALCKNERLKHIGLFLAVFPMSSLFMVLWKINYRNWIAYNSLFSDFTYVLFLLLFSTMNLVLINALLFMPKMLKDKKD